MVLMQLSLSAGTAPRLARMPFINWVFPLSALHQRLIMTYTVQISPLGWIRHLILPWRQLIGLKTTASSHQRAFLIEVMGRGCGYLALMTAIAGGAEAVVIPEIPTDPEKIADIIRKAYEHGKHHAIVVVAEGAEYNAEKLTQYFSKHRERLGFAIRATTLGHVQRGGAPSAYDRILASRLGAAAVTTLSKDVDGVLVGMIKGEIATTPLTEVAVNTKQIDLSLFELARILD